MLEFRIARRFLLRSKAQSLLIILGIAVGISIQVFVGSLITSLQDSLIDSTVGSSSHVTLEPARGEAAFTFASGDRSRVESLTQVTQVAPVQVLSALVPIGDDSATLVVRGGLPADLEGIYKLSERMVKGRATLADDELVLGKTFAEEFDVGVGDTITLVSADGTTSSATVEGVFDLGSQAANGQLAFVGLQTASGILGRSPELVSAVEIQIEDVFASPLVAAEVAAAFPGGTVTEWQTQNSELLTALESQTASSVLIQVFVIIAVMLGIASTLAISAVQKTRQVGILKALGMSDARTGFVFLYQAGVLGVLGTAAGIGLSLGLIAAFSFFATQGDTGLFPIEPRLGFVLLSAGIGIGIALASAVIPYRKTSRLDPIQVIQGG